MGISALAKTPCRTKVWAPDVGLLSANIVMN
jgi:hypothetical protein